MAYLQKSPCHNQETYSCTCLGAVGQESLVSWTGVILLIQYITLLLVCSLSTHHCLEHIRYQTYTNKCVRCIVLLQSITQIKPF